MALTTNKQNDNKTSNSSQVVYFKEYFGSPMTWGHKQEILNHILDPIQRDVFKPKLILIWSKALLQPYEIWKFENFKIWNMKFPGKRKIFLTSFTIFQIGLSDHFRPPHNHSLHPIIY